MRKDLSTILKSNIESPRFDLEADIVRAVYKSNSRTITLRFWSSVALGTLSIAGLVPAVKDLSAKLIQSGFYEYISLLFSSGGTLSKYSSDLAIALGESIPGVSITIFLIVVVALLWSVKNIFKESSSPYFKLSIN